MIGRLPALMQSAKWAASTLSASVTATFERFIQAIKAGDFETYEALHSLDRDRPVNLERFEANSASARRFDLQYVVESVDLDEEAETAVVHFVVSSPRSPSRIERDKIHLVFERGDWYVHRS